MPLILMQAQIVIFLKKIVIYLNYINFAVNKVNQRKEKMATLSTVSNFPMYLSPVHVRREIPKCN